MNRSLNRLHLYNTLSRRVEAVRAAARSRLPDHVRLRAHGTTTCNIGKCARAGGVRRRARRLLWRRYGLRYARNITDVDDKINAAARELEAPISAITDKYAAAYPRGTGAHSASTATFRADIEPAATRTCRR